MGAGIMLVGAYLIGEEDTVMAILSWLVVQTILALPGLLFNEIAFRGAIRNQARFERADNNSMAAWSYFPF